MNKLLLLALLLLSNNAYADYGHVTADEAMAVIVGAAGDLSAEEMLAVACVIRNNNSTEFAQERHADLTGMDDETKVRALDAWKDSLNGDITNGARRFHRKDHNGNFIRPVYKPIFSKDFKYIGSFGEIDLYA